MNKLPLRAKEQSNYSIDVAFLTAAGAAMTPDTGTVTWSLTDTDGAPINSRTNVAETSASTVTVLLKGNDLAFQDGETGDEAQRILTIYAEKDGTPIRDQAAFSIENLVAVN